MEEKKEDYTSLLEAESNIRKQLPYKVVVGGRVYKVRQVSQKVRTKIDNLAKESLFLERALKKETKMKRAKKLNRKIRSIHSRIAAYYLLGNWALFVPFLFAIKWRMLELRNSETVFNINNAGANDSDMAFFFANWEIIKGVLVLSMKSIEKGIEQFTERAESAAAMLEEDALPKKEEDSKSGVSSTGHRTTKR